MLEANRFLSVSIYGHLYLYMQDNSFWTRTSGSDHHHSFNVARHLLLLTEQSNPI